MNMSLLARSAAAITLCFWWGACQSQSEDIRNVEANDLGITQLRVEHHTDGDDKLLELVALDDSGQELAVATLRTGMVLFSPDPDVMEPGWSAGTELTVSVGAESISYASPDREAHEVRTPDDPRFSTFMRLQAVASEIRGEARIRFSAAADDAEVALIAGVCYGAGFPTTSVTFPNGVRTVAAVNSPTQCCGDVATQYFKIGGPTNAGQLGIRNMGTACRSSSGASGCVGTGCYFGPCGAHKDTTTIVNNTANAAVFHPTNFPNQCGRDSNGTAASGTEAPQAYASQTLWTGVTATCPWTDCDATSNPSYTGDDGFWLTITASCNETGTTGTVTWNGHSVSCDGNDVSETFWAPDASTKYVGASSPNYFMYWQGNQCNFSASPQCSGNWTTDVSIRASFTWCQGEFC